MRTDETGATAKRILIVEDDLVLQWAFARLAAKLGYSSACSSTALGALKLLTQGEFGLILLDAHLPDAHGSVILAEVRANLDGHSIPVVVVSSDDRWEHINMMRDQGADLFLPKPVSFADLAAALKRWLP